MLLAGKTNAATAVFPSANLEEISVKQLQEKMQQGGLTAVDIAKGYLKRIAAIDRKGPALNAVIEINPDALSIAAAMDKERKQGRLRGPLHGIPVLIKDNIDSGDKMSTTAGALALSDNKAKEDAFIIKQLRAAGAVLLGLALTATLGWSWIDPATALLLAAWAVREGIQAWRGRDCC